MVFFLRGGNCLPFTSNTLTPFPYHSFFCSGALSSYFWSRIIRFINPTLEASFQFCRSILPGLTRRTSYIVRPYNTNASMPNPRGTLCATWCQSPVLMHYTRSRVGKQRCCFPSSLSLTGCIVILNGFCVL